jgi:hypothetical protein
MPGFLLHQGAVVLCSHGGQATPTMANPRVMVTGMPTVFMSTPYVVAGCAFPPPPAANGPCVMGQYVVGTVRVTSMGQPLLCFSSTAICTPTGTPLLPPVSIQPRVVGM